MPGFDRSGPFGGGPRTGRGRGDCPGYGGGGGRAAGPGRGRGRARGFEAIGGDYGPGAGYGQGRAGFGGPGFRSGGCYPWETTAATQKELLENRSEYLEKQLQVIQAQLASLDQEE